MKHLLKGLPVRSALAAAAAVALAACATGPSGMPASGVSVKDQARYADLTPDSIQVFVNRVVRPYDLVKTVRAEVFVLDAPSEEAAELRAFREMLRQAKDAGANAVMEVRRSITVDSVTQRVDTKPPAGSSGMFRDDISPTSVALDELTLADYWRGKGTLSSARIDQTFQRRGLSQKSVVFSGKAIKLK